MSDYDNPVLILSRVFFEQDTMSGIIGGIGDFDGSEESWTSYVERFELFVECNGISDAKKVSTLLTVVGKKTYNLLRDLCTPDKPNAKSFKDIVKLIQDHLHPKPSFIAERYKFSKRNQLEGEGVAEYVANLKKMSTHCEFGASLNDFLRDRLVSGIRSDTIKQKLLSESSLTFDQAVKIVSSAEAAEKNAAALTVGSSGGKVLRVAAAQRRRDSGSSGGAQQHNQTSKSTPRPQHKSVQCFCCGGFGHMRNECRLLGVVVCHFCGKKNHLAKVCRSKLLGKSNKTYTFKNDKNNLKTERTNGQFSKNNKMHNFVSDRKSQINSNDSCDEYVDDISTLFQIEDEIEVDRPNNSNVNVKVAPLKIDAIVEGKQVTFEVDTGASVSVCSEDFYNKNLSFCKLQPNDLSLSSYTNEPIVPIGKIKVNVSYQDFKDNLDLYVIKKGAHPLMGRNWLQVLGVNISFKTNLLSDKNFKLLSHNEQFDKIVVELEKEFPKVFSDKLGQYKGDPVELKLKENATPKYFKPRPIPFSLKSKVEAELERLQTEEVLVPVSSSSWGTPIVPVLKKSGEIRICGDFKVTLNPFLEVEKYPLPRIEELFANLQGGQTFSKIDLSQAYMQLKLNDESKKLCTISTHKGLFSYQRMPYGISSAPGIFQKVIEQTLQGLEGVAVFLDDILITAKDTNTHLSRLREVLTRLNDKGFTIKKSKCKFFSDKLEYLGFCIDKEGLHTSQAKVEAIVKAPVPKNVTEVKAFIGLVNYYGKFIPNMSTILSPVYNLLKKDVPFIFNAECMQSFNKVKELLTNAPILAHYDSSLPVILATDASSTGLGCVLSIKTSEGVEKPVAYFSRTLSPTEVKYSQVEKEALAIVFGVKKCNQYLYGRRFTLCTDHKPLISIFGPKKGLPVFAASRLQRYALFLSGYIFDIKYVKSVSHGNADALSRLPLQVPHPMESNDFQWQGTYLNCIFESSVPLTFEHVKVETQKDPILHKVCSYVLHGWPSFLPEERGDMLPYFQRKEELTVEMGILMWGYKVVVPNSMRDYVLKELHCSHMGIVKMKSVARSYIWWPNIDQNIEALANSCSSCLMERSNPTKSFLHNWHYPSKPWERLHLDYFGPIRGKMFLIVVDAHTKWLEAFEVGSTSAKQAIVHLRDLFARFGLPVTCHSDNGPPFTSLEFKQFLKSNGVIQTFSPPYHAQSNGQAENSVRYAKTKLKCALNDNTDFNVALSRILFDYRNSVHAVTNETPAMLMFKRPLRTRLDLLKPNLPSHVECKQNKQREYFGGSKTRVLYPNQSVLIRDYRSKDKWVEGTVHKRLSNVLYEVRLSSGVVWKRHIDQLVGLQGSSNNDWNAQPETVCEPAVVPSADPPKTPLQQSHSQSKNRHSVSNRSPDRSTPATRHTSFPSSPSTPIARSPQQSPIVHPQTPVTTTARRYPSRIIKPVERLDL